MIISWELQVMIYLFLTSETSMCSGRMTFNATAVFSFAPVSSFGIFKPCFFARFFRMMGLYVSFMGKAMMAAISVMKIWHHCVHRQDLYCATKPPMTGPNTGPVKGAARNILVATARLWGTKRSAFVPAPTASDGLPARPARRRQMMRLAKELEKPAPSVKSMKIGEETRYTNLRP